METEGEMEKDDGDMSNLALRRRIKRLEITLAAVLIFLATLGFELLP